MPSTDTSPPRARSAPFKRMSALFLPLLLALLPPLITAGPPVAHAASGSQLQGNGPLDGKAVFLDFPRSGVPFTISWAASDGNVYSDSFFSLKGPNMYDLRAHSLWTGTPRGVRVDKIPGLRGEVRRPTVPEEITALFRPEIYLPRLVNLEPESFFFGIPWKFWTAGLFMLLCAVLIAVYGLKARHWILPTALVAVLAVGSIKNTASFYGMVAEIPDNDYATDMIGFQGYAAKLALGTQGKKTMLQKLPWPYDVHMRYCLSEIPLTNKRKADLLILKTGQGIGMIPNTRKKP